MANGAVDDVLAASCRPLERWATAAGFVGVEMLPDQLKYSTPPRWYFCTAWAGVRTSSPKAS